MRARFSNWCRWQERSEVLGEDLNSIGVYLIAQGLTRRTRANPSSAKIIYIGETTATLSHRLNAFARSCRYYYGGHEGGGSLFKAEVFPEFRQTRDELRERYGRNSAKGLMRDIIEMNAAEFDETWEAIRENLWVAIWTPAFDIEGRLRNLPHEYLPKVVEVNLQAEYCLRNNDLPLYNQQIG